MIFTLSVGDTPVQVVAGPASFDGRAAPANPTASPKMGEHTESLLTEVGYTAEQRADLRARKLAQ